MLILECIGIIAIQFGFIYARTWNVRAITIRDIPQVLYSATVIQIFWILTTAVGVSAVFNLREGIDIRQILILTSLLIGNILGSYWGMRKR